MSDFRIFLKDDDGKIQEYSSTAGAAYFLGMMSYESSIRDVEIHVQSGLTDDASDKKEFGEFANILFEQNIPFRVRFTQ